VRVVERGNGLAVVDARRANLACKASSLGRHWSKQKLGERFGDFVSGPTAEHVTSMSRDAHRPEPLGPLREDELWREYQDALDAARTRRDEQREALSSKIDTARAAHRRHFKLRHHAIAAMPIPGREKRKLYKMLSFERKAAERKLRATVKRGSWKEFLAARAARGDQRAIRRLRRQSRGLAIKSRENRLLATSSRDSRTSRGSIVHNLPGGVRLRESAGSSSWRRSPSRGSGRSASRCSDRGTHKSDWRNWPPNKAWKSLKSASADSGCWHQVVERRT